MLVIIPTYQERLNVESIVGRVRAAVPAARRPRRGRRAARTAPARSPTRSRRPTRRCTCCTGPARRASARPTSPASAGASSAATTSWSRWTPTARTSPSSCRGCWPRCATPTWCSGSRWVPGGSVVNWPRRREALSRGGNVYVRLALGLRAARRHRRLPRVPARARCETHRPGAVSRARATASRSTWPGGRCRQGCRVVEVPIKFVERERGDSKMSGAIVREALWRVTVWACAGAATRRRAGQPRPGGTDADGLAPGASCCSCWCRSSEIYVIVQVGQQIGALPTVLLLIFESAAGRLAAQAPRAAGPGGRCRRRRPRGRAADAGAGRRRARPGRRHAAADARASSPTSSGFFFVLPPTRPLARRLLIGAPSGGGAVVAVTAGSAVGRPTGPRRTGVPARRPWARVGSSRARSSGDEPERPRRAPGRQKSGPRHRGEWRDPDVEVASRDAAVRRSCAGCAASTSACRRGAARAARRAGPRAP